MSITCYHLLKTLFPKRADYLDMGYGIKARARRCDKFWGPHLAATRSFQGQTISKAPVEALAVLGAGRLLDVDLASIFEHAKRADFFDADPSAVAYCHLKLLPQLLKGKVGLYCAELSGRIDLWSEKLSKFLKSNTDRNESQLVSWLYDLADSSALQSSLKEYDSMFSLNLLSQIPLYWRDRVVSYLAQFWRYDEDCEQRYSEQLRQAIVHTKKTLQLGHLGLLSSKAKDSIVLITDSHFYFYQKDKAEWDWQEALFCEPKEVLASEFYLKDQDSWLWHIAPQDVEQEDYGVIHRVVASHWKRKA
jgi:hypothetical protein